MFQCVSNTVEICLGFGSVSKMKECLSSIFFDRLPSNCPNPPHLIQDLSFPRLVKEGSSGGVVWYEYMTTNETVLIKNLTIWVWICDHKEDLTIASPSNSYLEEFQSQVFSVKQRVLGKKSSSIWEPNTDGQPDKDPPKNQLKRRTLSCPTLPYTDINHTTDRMKDVSGEKK